ncbi:hypothetical protein Patl1_25879 [Pistacia atlantica]|uniref:Uncharacterized protein n=1 Tax=Pistacia atlantica TaxID=434234 RepID=A0ACC1B0H1_9ROSI|nr:hypothetical protein Patl1_25879 [Pistacia atlantica]
MMLLDACFIVKLLGGYTPGPHNEARRKETPAQLSHRFGTSKHINFGDNVRKGGWIMSAIRRDLLLVENQLPFFVLHAFFVEMMKIPMLKIDDNSESFFRNLIAHEQFLHDPDYSYVTDYLKFMNCLMNTPGDVELLCQSEVVQNGLGDDKVLANMFNRLSDNVTFFPASFSTNCVYSSSIRLMNDKSSGLFHEAAEKFEVH